MKKKQAKKALAKDIDEFFKRGIAEIVPEELFIKKMRNGERMRIYLGVDPTGPDVHVGHAVILRSMRRLQDLGHEIIFLIGDFTARIGDPTGKDQMRVTMTHEEILENAKTYKKQVGKILDMSADCENPVRFEFNSKWLDKLRFQDVIELASKFTVQQMVERDMFDQRIKDGKPIYLNEFLYPLMQGYDSVAMEVDAEVGGTDQLFNMLAGRTLLKEMKGHEKAVVTFDLLEGLDGRKMSKSYKNIVGVLDGPNDMYGKVMALDDSLVPKYFKLCTDLSMDAIKGVEKEIKDGANPRDLKMRLARELVTIYHSEKAANKAEEEFINVFRSKNKPTEVSEHKVSTATINIIDLVVEAGFAKSKSDARRLIQQGGVKINDNKILDIEEEVQINGGEMLQVGKRKFAKLVS